MEVDVEDSPTTSPVKQNGMVVEVAGPVVIQYKDKKNREKVRDRAAQNFQLKCFVLANPDCPELTLMAHFRENYINYFKPVSFIDSRSWILSIIKLMLLCSVDSKIIVADW